MRVEEWKEMSKRRRVEWEAWTKRRGMEGEEWKKKRGMNGEEWMKRNGRKERKERSDEGEAAREGEGDREVDRQIYRIYLLSILCPLSMNPVYRSTRSGSAELSITNSQVSK
jgi:hypothetical protein